LVETFGELKSIFPKIVSEGRSAGHFYRVYNTGSHDELSRSDARKAIVAFTTALWSLDPSDLFQIDGWEAQSGLTSRLSTGLVDRLNNFASISGYEVLGYNSIDWHAVLSWVDSLPLQLSVPVGENNLLYDSELKSACCLDWSAVSVEPIGYAPNGGTHRVDIETALAAAASSRSDLAVVTPEDIAMVASLSRLDFFLERCRYLRAVESLKEFVGLWNGMETVRAKELTVGIQLNG